MKEADGRGGGDGRVRPDVQLQQSRKQLRLCREQKKTSTLTNLSSDHSQNKDTPVNRLLMPIQQPQHLKLFL